MQQNPYVAKTIRVEDPVYKNQLIISDTRSDASNGWNITATLSTPLTNTQDKKLIGALRYVRNGKEVVLSSEAQVIHKNDDGVSGNYNVTDSWGSTKGSDGIKLQIESSDRVYTGDYVGVITWKIVPGQP